MSLNEKDKRNYCVIKGHELAFSLSDDLELFLEPRGARPAKFETTFERRHGV